MMLLAHIDIISILKTDTVSEGSLGWLLRASRDPMLVSDASGVIVLANEPLCALLGWPVEELLGEPVELLVPPAARGRHAALRHASTGAARAMGAGRFDAFTMSGANIPVEISLSPFQTEDGMRLTLATVYDLRPRLRAEQELRDSEERMRAVFETAVDGIITIDEAGRIERLNRAAERIFGYAEHELAGRNIATLMPPLDRERHDGYLRHYLATGERRILGRGREVQGLRKDGRRFPMELAVAEMRIGERRMFTGQVRDISARKAAELENARLLDGLRVANEELENFAYVVSHDLKAPLRAIGSLADWLSTDYGDRFDDEGREHMRLLIGRVHRMGALIDGILAYSRVGRRASTLQVVDLNEAVAEAVDLLGPPPAVRVEVQAGLPIVLAEPTRIRQVFANLVSNAIKYMDKAEGQVTVACTDAGAAWRFSVADNGPGIEARHFERIFQLFQTLAPRDRVESTGVGLALVKKIVEIAGGRIWVESTPGHGSTFFFTYPKLPQAANTHETDE
ncbi:sensor histidine kinase [Massilia brevitalea]|uniref:sensor histidine kinase n=1 Tax=Massilia brevitalea TaxID=442526 RepID=UPI0027389687|nr:PAS domain S-box protein [Massilia brevitalea]